MELKIRDNYDGTFKVGISKEELAKLPRSDRRRIKRGMIPCGNHECGIWKRTKDLRIHKELAPYPLCKKCVQEFRTVKFREKKLKSKDNLLETMIQDQKFTEDVVKQTKDITREERIVKKVVKKLEDRDKNLLARPHDGKKRVVGLLGDPIKDNESEEQ